jgi:hypothetical protein
LEFLHLRLKILAKIIDNTENFDNFIRCKYAHVFVIICLIISHKNIKYSLLTTFFQFFISKTQVGTVTVFPERGEKPDTKSVERPVCRRKHPQGAGHLQRKRFTEEELGVYEYYRDAISTEKTAFSTTGPKE